MIGDRLPKKQKAKNERTPLSNITRIPELIGRGYELGRLETAISLIRKEGRVLFITGDAGLGKSKLLKVAARQARAQGITPIQISCRTPQGVPGLLPWLEAIRALDNNDAYKVAMSSVVQKSESIKQLVEETRSRDFSGSRPLERIPLWLGLNRLFLEASRCKPIMLVFEDIDEIDSSSRQLLEFIANGMVYPEMLLVLTQRTGGLARFTETISLGLTDFAHYEELTLTRLSNADVRELALRINSSLTEVQLVELEAIAEGNPHFVSEYSQHSLTGSFNKLPDSISELVSARLTTLSKNAFALIQKASLLGLEFEISQLESLTGQDNAQLQHLIHELINNRFVKAEDDTGETYRFSNPVIREVITRLIPLPEKQHIHFQIAELLIAGAVPVRDAVIAEHLRLAPDLTDPQRTIEYMLKAATSARNKLGYEVAIQHLDNIRLLPKLTLDDNIELSGEINLRLGDCYLQNEGVEAAEKYFLKAREIASVTGNSTTHAIAILGLSGGMQPLLGSGAADMLTEIQHALETLEAETTGNHADREALKLRVRLRSRLVHFQRPVNRELIDFSDATIDQAKSLGDTDCLGYALVAKHALLVNPSFDHERLVLSDQIREVGRTSMDRDLIALGYLLGFSDNVALGNVKAAMSMQAELSTVKPEVLYRDDVARMAATCLSVSGDYEQAIAMTESVSTSALGPSLIRVMQMFQIRRAQHRLAEMQPMMDAIGMAYPDQHTIQVHRCLCFAELNQLDEARSMFLRLVANNFSSLPEDPSWKSSLVALVEVCFILDDVTAAALLLPMLEPYENKHISQGSNWYYGAGAFFVGLLNIVLGDKHLATARFEKALLMHEGMKAAPMVERTSILLSQTIG